MLRQEDKKSETQKKYSETDIAKIKAIQDLRKRHISYKNTRLSSARDLGEPKAIDIHKKSAENLRKLKDRLKKGMYLTEADQLTLAKEKKAEAILTPNELPLFKSLINKKYLLKHTTSVSSIEKISANDAMLDPQEIKRRGTTCKEATPDYCGIEQNIFFGIGSKQSTLPCFVRSPVNYETQKLEDYATIQIDYTKLLEAHSHIRQSVWTSGHFSHYLRSGANTALKKSTNSFLNLARAILILETHVPPVTMGSATFAREYADKSLEQQACDALAIANPLFRTQNKELSFFRLDLTNLHYEDEEKIEKNMVTQPLDIDSEISSGGDVLPFLAYSFIERLRFLGGTMRDYLLSHPEDHNMIDYVLEKFFRVDDFELHIPSQLPLSPTYTTIMTPQERKKMTAAVSRASAAGDVNALEELIKNDYPLDGYMYEDPYYFDHTPATTLPLIAALQTGQIEAVIWLIKHGANRSVFSSYDDEKSERLKQVDYNEKDSTPFFTAAFNSGKISVLNCLKQHGLDLNAHYKDFVEKRKEEKQTKYYKHYSDDIFIAALTAATKTNSFDMLNVVLEQSSYVNDPQVQKERLIYDMVIFANEKVFLHVLNKFQAQIGELNYTALFVKAVDENNFQLIPYLFSKANYVAISPFVSEFDLALSHEYEKYTEINFFHLQEFALDQLANGHVETSEWLLKKIGRSIYSLKPSEIERIGAKLNSDGMKERLSKTIGMSSRDSIYDVLLSPSELSTTLLTQAIKNEFNELVHQLMKKYKINASNKFATQESPIVEAIMYGNLSLANDFISQGVKLPQDMTMVKYIIREKKLATLQWLVKHGIQITDENVAFTAMTEGTPEIIEILSAGGIIMPSKSRAKELFSLAIARKNLKILNWLIKHYEFDPKLYQDQFIDMLVENSSSGVFFIIEELVDWLVAHGLDFNLPNLAGMTVLDKMLSDVTLISETETQFLEEHLKPRGIDVDAALKINGTNLLMRAISSDSYNNSLLGKTALPYLFNKGVPINVVFTREHPISPCAPITPLEYASSLNGNPKTVKQLLDAGAKATFTPDENATALHYACGLSLGANERYKFRGKDKSGQVEIIKLLLAANAPVNIGKESPLSVLLRQENPLQEAIAILLAAGADPQYRSAPEIKKSNNKRIFLTAVDRIYSGLKRTPALFSFFNSQSKTSTAVVGSDIEMMDADTLFSQNRNRLVRGVC